MTTRKTLCTNLVLGWGRNMKYGVRELNGASCKILKPISLPADMHKGIREITCLEVPPALRSAGRATALLEMVCKEADERKMILMLTVDPFGDLPGPTKDQLINWYGASFDFHVIQQVPTIMSRMYAIYVKPVLSEEIGRIVNQET